MGAPREDPVALLLPDAADTRREAARRLVTALRIFASDALDSGSSSVNVQLERAREELEGHRVVEVRAALRDVLLHAAARCVRASSFTALAVPAADHTSAWARLLDRLGDRLRRELGVELLPAGATARAQLESLVAAQERLAETTEHPADRADADLWRARLVGLDGDRDASAPLDALLESLGSATDAQRRRCAREAAADRAARALDAGRPDRAVEACARAAAIAGSVAERPSECEDALDALAHVARWATSTSDCEGVPDLRAAFSGIAGGVPEPWAQLREILASGADGAAPLGLGPRGTSTDGDRRRTLGAQAVVVLAVDPDGRTRPIDEDVAPGLKHSVDRWAADRRDAIGSRGTIEHDAVRTGAPHALVRCRERPRDGVVIDRACLDPDVAPPAAVVAVPVLDGDAEVVGLVWIELSHRLVPGPARCANVADAASRRLAGEREERTPIRIPWGSSSPPNDVGPGRRPSPAARLDDAHDELAAAWSDAMRRVGLKTAERRWVAFQAADEAGALVAAAEGGGGVELGRPTEAGAWAVRRAQRTGGHVRYADDDVPRRPMMHRGAASGAALALRAGGSVRAVLVVESIRRGDARERDVARWYERLQDSADRLEVAMLHARDRELFDGGFVVDCEAPDGRRRIERLRAIARTRGDVLVVGEEGSGRRTAARWLGHHRARSTAFAALSAFGLEVDRLEASLAGGGVVVLSDLESLSAPAQAALARWLERPFDARASLVATTTSRRDAPAPAMARGRLHSDLAARLERVVLATPPLRETRHEIPGLVRFLARRFASSVAALERGERPCAVAEIEDAATALLWRQPWPGNAAQLDGVLHAAVLLADGGPVGADAAADALAQRGLDPVLRLPSRDPDPRDVASAAWATRTASGRINKTRTALYLGWDPNTVAARLRDLGLDGLAAVEAVLAGEAPADPANG
ncbi:MAG: hypothetical protein AAGI22_15805 [Planctomycetota bacterium]